MKSGGRWLDGKEGKKDRRYHEKTVTLGISRRRQAFLNYRLLGLRNC